MEVTWYLGCPRHVLNLSGCIEFSHIKVGIDVKILLSGIDIYNVDAMPTFKATFSVPTLPSKPLPPHDSAEGETKKLGMKTESKELFVMSCVRRLATASLITTLLVPVTRQKVPPYCGGWLHRLLFVLWQIHSTCVTGVDLSPRQSGEDEIGRGTRGTRPLLLPTLSACLSPSIKIDIGRPSRCLFLANLHCFWRR